MTETHDNTSFLVTDAPLAGKIPHCAECQKAQEENRANVWGPMCVACMYQHGWDQALARLMWDTYTEEGARLVLADLRSVKNERDELRRQLAETRDALRHVLNHVHSMRWDMPAIVLDKAEALLRGGDDE